MHSRIAFGCSESNASLQTSRVEKEEELMLNSSFISLFSGAGGLDAGLEAAGWQGRYASDIDNWAVATLQRNAERRTPFLRDAHIESADVRNLTGSNILSKVGVARGAIPLLVGGPPCQSWSSAGHQHGMADPRGRLFADFIRLAGELDVRWLLFENVRGLLTARGPDGRPGSALELIRQQLLRAGFQTSVTLINAADFGVAQRRVRLFVFGYRTGDPLIFPNPTHCRFADDAATLPWISLGDVLSSIDPPMDDEIIRPAGLLAQQMRDLPAGTGVKSPGKRESTRPGGHWGYKQGAFIADLALPSRTVTANPQQDWIRDPVLGLRRLSPRECAAIQSFPSDWSFAGKRLDQYRLIGNAVPPKLAETLGCTLLEHVRRPTLLEMLEPKVLTPLPPKLISAVRYTEREQARNGASRMSAPNRRSRTALAHAG